MREATGASATRGDPKTRPSAPRRRLAGCPPRPTYSMPREGSTGGGGQAEMPLAQVRGQAAEPWRSAMFDDLLLLPGETTDRDADHRTSLRERGESMAYTGRHVHLEHMTATLLVPVARDPAMARRTTQGDGVLCCAHCSLRHTARQGAPPGAPRRRADGWQSPGAGQRASRRLLPDPDPALACGKAETTHMAVGDRVRLPTP